MPRPLGVPSLLVLGGIAWAGVHLVAHRATELAGPSGGHAHVHGAGQAAYLPTSLSLCLSLALVLAAATSVYPRWRTTSASSLWLFTAVPLLGLFAGAVVDSGGSLSGLETHVVELLPVAGLVLVVQIGVAVAAVRVARGLLDIVAGTVHALVGPRPPRPAPIHGSSVLADADRVPAARLALGGSPRAPPGFSPAFWA